MLERQDWKLLLDELVGNASCNLEVTTFFEVAGTASQPARVSCSDGQQYWIKGAQLGKTPFNEQIVGLLARSLDAPVPEVKVANLAYQLQNAEPKLAHFLAGPVHASRLEPNCTDRQGFQYFDEVENRSRFSALVLVYTLTLAGDHQFIYKKQAPHLVFSVDHGHFFRGPNWTIATLAAEPKILKLDPAFDAANLKPAELVSAFERIENLTVLDIAAIVARPPASWQVSEDERIAMCEYLERRREELLTLNCA